MLVLNVDWKLQIEINQITATVQERIQIIEVGKVVLRLAASHDEDDGWPESVEEHVTLVLLKGEYKEYRKDMLQVEDVLIMIQMMNRKEII